MPALVSPPGKFSQRTDKNPIVEPDLDRPDMQYGDRQELVDAQRIARKSVAEGSKPGERRMTGEAKTGGGVPPFLMQTPSSRPLEPITSGLASGPGAGPEALTATTPAPDVRTEFLQYASETFGNREADDMLDKMAREREASFPRPTATPPGFALPAEEQQA